MAVGLTNPGLMAPVIQALRKSGLDLADVRPLVQQVQQQQAGAMTQPPAGQFDLSRLLEMAGTPIPTPISSAGEPLPGAEGQTFAPNVPFSGGSVFPVNERPAMIQNSLLLAQNLSRAINDLRRKAEARKKKQKAERSGGSSAR